MQLTEEPFDEIRDWLPKAQGDVRWGRRVLNGILYVLQSGYPWLSLPVLWALEHGVHADEALDGAWFITRGKRVRMPRLAE